MRNKVAKRLRKEAGNQNSTSNQLEYKELKRMHMEHTTEPKLKVSENTSGRKATFWKKEMKRREKKAGTL